MKYPCRRRKGQKVELSNRVGKKELLSYIQRLSDAYGPSGFEHEVSALTLELAGPFGESSVDCMQNVYVKREGFKGDRLRVQLDAHLDEVGLIVHSICADGMLRIMTLGSWVPERIPAHAFRVRTRDGRWIRAISVSMPPHYMSDDAKHRGITIEAIELDVGARSRHEAEDVFGVYIAAPVAPDVTFAYDEQHDLLFGKAFDCRIGCAALTETLRRLDGEELACDVVAAYSVQEEVGGRGAVVTARQVEADLAIVFEGTPADDYFEHPDQTQTAIGRGAMLRHIDRTMITHPGFQKYALELARTHNIPVQEGVRRGGGTNGAPIHTEGAGIPTIVIGIPVRYIHTHYGWAKLCDVEAAVALATELLRSFDESTLEKLVY